MKTFVTFLGRGREDRLTGYKKATYEFPDESQKTTPFFGLALADHIKPERVVILGTSGSQWGVLVENLAAADEEEDARLVLFEAEIKREVTQAHLDEVVDLMSRAVKCEVVPRLIPFGKDESEQYEILDVIAKNVPEGIVDFDLTHGFRHFGMIGFLSAFMLARVQKLKVRKLWYGALEMAKDGMTPVLQLDGLDRVRQWLDALNRFEATGDYRVFSALIAKDGVEEELTKHLERAAFHERTFNLSAAADEIRQFKSVLEGTLTGASGLFREGLAERLAWVDRDTYSKQQADLAWQYLRRRDYLRAVIFARETIVTIICEKGKLNPKNPSIRRDNEPSIDDIRRYFGSEEVYQKSFDMLNTVRNALAHLTPNPRLETLLLDEETLRKTLEEAFKCLLPDISD